VIEVGVAARVSVINMVAPPGFVSGLSRASDDPRPVPARGDGIAPTARDHSPVHDPAGAAPTPMTMERVGGG